MSRFTVPRDIYFGENAIEQLKDLKGSRAMLVIGSERLIKDGTIPRIMTLLGTAGIEAQVYSGISADPTIAEVREGVAKMNAFSPDIIIGVGGGSPIDAAKAMWIFYEYPNFTFEEAAVPFNLPTLRQKATFVAIPTTSGTGTEVTSFSVITDDKTGIKYPIADYNLTPDMAIVDPVLAESMTPELIANTGMDALTHAFEAYVSTVANPFTDALAIKAITMTVENIIASYKGDKTARHNMHIAQCIAGMAFSNAILGIVHSMAHKTGKIFDVPHGCANAIYLPYAIQYNAKTAAAKYAEIARRIGLMGKDDQELTALLVTKIGQLRTEMQMPATLKEFGLAEDVFKANLDGIAATAVQDPCTGTNPREINADQMRKLFEAVYYGSNVDF